jgi:hypothetical protein
MARELALTRRETLAKLPARGPLKAGTTLSLKYNAELRKEANFLSKLRLTIPHSP